MSEEKVIQHTKGAINALAKKDKSWKDRMKEFLYEILIIVIAVSITLWLHNWNDHRHEVESVHNYLAGTRDDLETVKKNLGRQLSFDSSLSTYYMSVIAQIKKGNIDKDALDSSGSQLLNNLYFYYDDSRFEEFKYSGRLQLIENKKLLTSITRLYITDLPFTKDLVNTTYDNKQKDFQTYVGTKLGEFPAIDSVMDVSKIIDQSDVRYFIKQYGFWIHSNVSSEQELMKEVDNTIKEIEEELNK